MEDKNKPVGGKWNFDHENRNFDKNHIPSWSWKPSDITYINEARSFYDVKNLSFTFPVSRKDAL